MIKTYTLTRDSFVLASELSTDAQAVLCAAARDGDLATGGACLDGERAQVESVFSAVQAAVQDSSAPASAGAGASVDPASAAAEAGFSVRAVLAAATASRSQETSLFVTVHELCFACQIGLAEDDAAVQSLLSSPTANAPAVLREAVREAARCASFEPHSILQRALPHPRLAAD